MLTSPTNKNSQRLWIAIYIILACAMILYWRLGSIVYHFVLNPDEAQAGANAIRIWHYGLTWKHIDGTTVGPFNSLILTWPYLFGLGVTLLTVRLTAIFLIFVQISALTISFYITAGTTTAILASLPLVVFYAFVRFPDFTHYTSEVLSITLCLVAFSMIVINYASRLTKPKHNSSLLFLSGLLIGCVPFSKMQVVPVAAVIGLLTLILIYLDKQNPKLKMSLIYISGVTIIPAFMFGAMFFNGSLADFYYSYIKWSGIYVRDMLSLKSFYSLLQWNPMVFKTVSACLFMALMSFIYAMAFVKRKRETSELILKCFALAIVIVSILVISWPGRKVPHYLVIIIPVACIFYSVIISDIKYASKLKHIIIHSAIILVMMIYFMAPPTITNFNKKITRNKDLYPSGMIYEIKPNNLFDWIVPSEPRSMVAWGWMPVYYMHAGMPSASRETHNFGQLMETELKPYFRDRFIDDIKLSKPNLIIDAVTKGAFAFNDQGKYGTKTFPALQKIIDEQYTEFSKNISDDCPHTYLLNADLDRFHKKNIHIRDISASATHQGLPLVAPANLDDNNVIEGTCTSYWILPDKTSGSITFEFEDESALSELWILNTRNGTENDRASHQLRIDFVKDQHIIKSESIIARKYPYWTILTLGSPAQVDKVVIHIEAFIGVGGGLNEVKFFKDL